MGEREHPAHRGAPADPALFGAWVREVAMAEAEHAVLVLLAANGFPTDLARAPSATEVRSRTSYAAMEADVGLTTAQVAALVVAARAASFAAVAGTLAGAVTVVEVLRRLDLAVAGLVTVPGLADVVVGLEPGVRGQLAALARRSVQRMVTDAARAGIIPTTDTSVEAMAADPALASTLDAQASRIATDTTARALVDLRERAHALAGQVAATSAAPTADAAGTPVGAAEFLGRLVDAARAADGPTEGNRAGEGLARSIRDSVHQGALAANGAGRMAAAAAYDPASAGAGGGAGTGGRAPLGSPWEPPPPPDGRDPGAADFVPEAGAWFHSSELLDRHTCSPCSEVDGKEYRTYAAALQDYPTGTYRLCEGGSRCRGVIIMVSPRESAATSRGGEPVHPANTPGPLPSAGA